MAFLDLFNAAHVLKLRLLVYGLLIFFSFFIFVGIAVMKDKETFDRCPLYLEKSGHTGSEGNCDYPMAIAIMFQLCYLCVRVAMLVLVLIGKLAADFFLFSDIFELIYVAVDLVVFFLTFVGACILSAGSNAAYSDYDFAWRPASRAAQAGAWISTFLWLFIGLCGFLCLWRAGKIPFLKAPAGTSQPQEGTAPGPQSDFPSTPPAKV